MTLALLKVFDKYAYTRRTELLTYNFQLWNSVTQGGITLTMGNQNRGNYADETYWKSKTVTRRRNANAVTAIGQVAMEMGSEASVKVDAGTPELIFYEADMRRILQDPEGEGIIFGEQLAEQMFSEMVNTALGAYCAAMAAQATNYTDVGAVVLKQSDLLAMAYKGFGDKNGDVKTWLLHSKVHLDLLQAGLTNAGALFSWSNVNVFADAQGRPLIVTDASPLVIPPATFDYYTPGLVPGGIVIQANDDFNSNEIKRNGKEQIETSYQAEWSYNLRLKGHTWDKANGGSSPNDAALFLASNWDKTVTDQKNLPGVLLRSL